ncbi:MAG: asparagine synthase (glutamine-hydrolyzing) [Candidatus Omnitrophica bacterium]|nr:asparagine synthase (glutamine-hydrolyzing) [Candidatus Omnitrophota bacterium]
MCGIAGILRKRPGPPVGPIAAAMADAIAHRGPDDAGLFDSAAHGVALAHRRLSIIDLSPSGHQPMANDDGTVQLVFNGEIYNFQELTQTLAAAGYRFRSHSDTEVIVHAYEQWGESCVAHLRGMFAFALWDARRETLLLARDRIGIKPLYYLDGPQGLAFASEAKAFLALPSDWGVPQIDDDALRMYVAYQCVWDHGKTMLAGVAKLPPGHVMVVQRGLSRLTRYWELREDPAVARLPFRDAVAALDATLTEAVRSHLVADVPVGILLSGGLDSSVVAALAARQGGQVRTFTVGFPHRWDERPWAAQVARHLGTAHQELNVDPTLAWDQLLGAITSFDDLSSADAGLLTTRLMAAQARAHGIKVLLVGEGADEIFGGYPWFGLSQQPFASLPEPWWWRGYYYGATRQGIRFRPVLRPMWQQAVERPRRDPFRAVAHWEVTRQLPNHLLRKVDKATMAAGVEARVPYLDHRVVEFAYSCPRAYKLPGRWFRHRQAREKWILRALAAAYLPPAIAARKKQGWLFPVGEFLIAHAERIREIVDTPRSRALTALGPAARRWLFTPQRWQPLEWERHMLLWKLLVLELWIQTFLTRRATPQIAPTAVGV